MSQGTARLPKVLSPLTVSTANFPGAVNKKVKSFSVCSFCAGWISINLANQSHLGRRPLIQNTPPSDWPIGKAYEAFYFPD